MSTPIALPLGPAPTQAENRRIQRLLGLRHMLTVAGVDVTDWDRRFDDLTAMVLARTELRGAVTASTSAGHDPVALEAELVGVEHSLAELYRDMLDDAIDHLHNPAAEVA